MTPTKGTPTRTVRVSDELWNAAKAKAEAEGTEVGAVIRAALRKYVGKQAE